MWLRSVRVLGNALTFLRDFGVKRFLLEARYRLIDHYYERRFGTDTGGMVKLPEIGIHYDEFLEYVPMGYSAIYSALRQVPLPPSDTCFLDYGSSKGRAVVAAAALPFARMRNRKARVVQTIQSDAVEFAIPDDINLIYMWNPFRRSTRVGATEISGSVS